MANHVDTSRLLGVDTISGIVDRAWTDTARAAAQYSPTLLALALVTLYLLVFWIISRVLHGAVRRVMPPDARSVTHRILRVALRLTLLMLVLISVTALFEPLARYGPAIFRVYALLLVYVGWNVLEHLLHRQTLRWGLDASLELLMKNVVRVVWVISGIYLVFGQFSVNLLPILGGLGVLGLAVGFATQDILANLISGVTLRTTRIRDNEFVSIPNKDVAGAVVVNLSAGGPFRLNVLIGVEYKERAEDVRRILLDVMTAHPRTEKEPAPLLLVRELSASSMDVITRFWVSEANIASYPVISMQIREAAKEALQAGGMSLPFPHLQVHGDGAKGPEAFLPAAPERLTLPQREEH
ncbi:Mechanosensitive ion channel family protein [Deinococcus saxicola]|uniref:mechanosensitive ion channel family protein n=1 Tax=Deinococcus saxicola TaxID=249406 RepID=UPI0039F0BEC3